MPTAVRRVKYDDTYQDLLAYLNDQGTVTAKDILSKDYIDEQLDRMRILQTITMPEEAIDRGVNVRYKDEFMGEPTATQGIKDLRKCDWIAQPTAGNGINMQIGPSDMYIATFNDSPWCLMVMYDPNAGCAQWDYKWSMNGDFVLRVNAPKSTVLHNYSSTTNLYKPHGVFEYSGKDLDGVRYQWIDGKNGTVDVSGNASPSTLRVTALANPTVTGGQIQLIRWNNGNATPYSTPQALTNGVTVYNFTINISDYYAVAIIAIAGTVAANLQAAGFNIEHFGTCSVLAHFAAKNILAHAAQLSKCGRILALSVRLTDVAALQYLQGEVAVATNLDGNAWYPMFMQGGGLGTDCYDTVASYPKAIVGPLPEGAYTYHKPAKKEDYGWKEWVVLDPLTGLVLDLWWPMETNTPVKIIAATTNNIGNNNGNTGLGAQCYVTLAYCLEWQTTDDWTPTGIPSQSSLAWRNALEELMFFPDATGNAWHWKDLITGIAKAVSWTAPVWRAAIKVGGAALDTLAPGTGLPAQVLANAGLDAVVRYAGRKRK